VYNFSPVVEIPVRTMPETSRRSVAIVMGSKRVLVVFVFGPSGGAKGAARVRSASRLRPRAGAGGARRAATREVVVFGGRAAEAIGGRGAAGGVAVEAGEGGDGGVGGIVNGIGGVLSGTIIGARIGGEESVFGEYGLVGASGIAKESMRDGNFLES
jgi:hypothetical protein